MKHILIINNYFLLLLTYEELILFSSLRRIQTLTLSWYNSKEIVHGYQTF
jgi:hypothetical protein